MWHTHECKCHPIKWVICVWEIPYVNKNVNECEREIAHKCWFVEWKQVKFDIIFSNPQNSVGFSFIFSIILRLQFTPFTQLHVYIFYVGLELRALVYVEIKVIQQHRCLRSYGYLLIIIAIIVTPKCEWVKMVHCNGDVYTDVICVFYVCEIQYVWVCVQNNSSVCVEWAHP